MKLMILMALVILFGRGPAAFATDSATTPNHKTKTLFQTKCATCHGSDGSGTTLGKRINVRDLRSADVQKQSSPDLAQAILEGKKNMPSFAGSLTKAQVDALVAYVRGFAGSK